MRRLLALSITFFLTCGLAGLLFADTCTYSCAHVTWWSNTNLGSGPYYWMKTDGVTNDTSCYMPVAATLKMYTPDPKAGTCTETTTDILAYRGSACSDKCVDHTANEREFDKCTKGALVSGEYKKWKCVGE